MDIGEIVGENLRRVRLAQNLSLGQLAAQSGVSKVMLSQIEKGVSNPSVNTVWKIADALQVPYTALLERNVDGGTVISAKDVPAQALDAAQGFLRCYYHHTRERNFELFEMTILPGGTQTSQGHGERTEEYTLVVAGTLTVTLDDGEHVLQAGDAIRFHSNKQHSYRNSGSGELRLVILNDYR
jgi:transcriptional regulator with XRE-family HTH domain